MNRNDDGTFHGSFVRNRGEGRGVRVARAKVSELPVPDPTTVQEAALELQAAKGQWPNRNSPTKARRVGLTCLPGEVKPRKTKLAVMGIPSHILDKGSPEYARCIRMAKSYKKARIKELYAAHGYVSTGVSALVAAAALALSGSRYIYETCAENVLANPNLLKLASSLGDSARQNELSAWELCARESVVRKRNENNNISMPWLIEETKRLPGRPKKAIVIEESFERREEQNAGPTGTINMAEDEGGSEEHSS